MTSTTIFAVVVFFIAVSEIIGGPYGNHTYFYILFSDQKISTINGYIYTPNIHTINFSDDIYLQGKPCTSYYDFPRFANDTILKTKLYQYNSYKEVCEVVKISISLFIKNPQALIRFKEILNIRGFFRNLKSCRKKCIPRKPGKSKLANLITENKFFVLILNILIDITRH